MFYHSVLRNSWYSFYRSRKDERLSQPWSIPAVLKTGPLDWESNALTLGHCSIIVPLAILTYNIPDELILNVDQAPSSMYSQLMRQWWNKEQRIY